MKAAAHGHEDMIALLLSNGGDIRIKDNVSINVIEMASMSPVLVALRVNASKLIFLRWLSLDIRR
jgi:ankyrin repeat protein